MNHHIAVFAVLLALLGTFTATAQTNAEKAAAEGTQAVKLEDEGKFDEAIKLLEDAQKLDPQALTYPYELAYSYYSKQDYQKAIGYLKPLTRHDQVINRIFQLLGNAYDDSGQSEKALAAYDEGLKKFPKAGNLFLEKGTVYLKNKDYNKAINCYEQGIEADPAFPSNYYRAAKLYCGSTEPVWGLIYGEIFMNLERNSRRTQEMSKLLYDTYLQHISIKNDTVHTSFTKNNNISINMANKDNPLAVPYPIIYEMNIAVAIPAHQNLSLNALDSIRTTFLNTYYQHGYNKRYPNALFAYQKKINDAGFFPEYNHWLLMMGDEAAFTKWQAAGQAGWDNFAKWFNSNGLQANKENRFYRHQYQ